jgi:hypothetical protein
VECYRDIGKNAMFAAISSPEHSQVDDYACYSDDDSSLSDYSSSAVEKLSTSAASMTSLDTEAVLEDIRPTTSRVPPLATSVKINVEGAFIVDEDCDDHSPSASVYSSSDHVHRENKDIRLPHHTDVVSHVAVDVCAIPPLFAWPY